MVEERRKRFDGNYQDVPKHVPRHLIKAFDFNAEPGMEKCPFATTHRLHAEPEGVFWNSIDRRFGGSWVPTRAEDIRFILSQPGIFSSKDEAAFSQLMGESWDLIPLEVDPPQHTKFRALLAPLVSPGVVGKLTSGIEHRSASLIEKVRDTGSCEFMKDFGRPFPIGVFMELMGLPEGLYDTFLGWEFDLLHAPELSRKVAAATAIRDFLRDLAEERRERPTGDLTSTIVAADIDGRPLTDDEVMGILYLFFVGGLDTVASSLGFFFRHLAEHSEQQARLRANPELIPRAIEELLRRYSVVILGRQCTRDVEVGGVGMKKGDWITIVDALGSLDPNEFDEPMNVDFERKNNRHFAFNFGPHFCLGSHLARRELNIAVRAWLSSVPQWRLKPGAPVIVHGGLFGVEHLELEWDIA